MSEERTYTKYKNRRLYCKVASKYVTLRDIEDAITAGESVRVIEAEGGNDVTVIVLLNILLEIETKSGFHGIRREHLVELIRDVRSRITDV